MPGYYNEDNEWIEDEFPPDDGGGGNYDPYDYYPQQSGGGTQPSGGSGDGSADPYDYYPQQPPQQSRAVLARAKADQAERVYLAAQEAWKQSVRKAQTDETYNENPDSYKAIMDAARYDWNKLDREADVLETAEGKTATPKGGTAGGYMTPNTSAPYILQAQPDGSMKQIPNPNYRPPASGTSLPSVSTAAPYLPERKPDGSIGWVPNPNYRTPQPAGSTSSPAAMGNLDVARQRLAYDMAKAAREQDWEQYKYLQTRQWALEDAAAKAEGAKLANEEKKKEQEAQNMRLLQRAAWDASRQRLATQSSLQQGALGIAGQMARGLPPAGQSHWAGWEPGGPVSQIYGMGNSKYNPDLYKSPTPQYNEWWARMNDWFKQMWEAQAPPAALANVEGMPYGSTEGYE